MDIIKIIFNIKSILGTIIFWVLVVLGLKKINANKVNEVVEKAKAEKETAQAELEEAKEEIKQNMEREIFQKKTQEVEKETKKETKNQTESLAQTINKMKDGNEITFSV